MIYCVWYPAGGFGHYINAVLSLHGDNFARPAGNLIFTSFGDSHSLDLAAPKYFHDCENYQFDFDNHTNYSVLVDNGDNGTSEKFRTVFPTARVIRVCYTDYSWPVVARANIEKGMDSDLATQLPSWDTADWAVREKYFLFLRDHTMRMDWKPNNTDFVMHVEQLFDYQTMRETLESCGIELDDFQTIWHQWRQANAPYINPVETAQRIINTVQHNQDLSSINDIWTQAVVYYFIWLKFKFEVPHNDYSNWFTNTKDIVKMLDNYGVAVDTN